MPLATRPQFQPPNQRLFSTCFAVSVPEWGQVRASEGVRHQPAARLRILEHLVVPTARLNASFSALRCVAGDVFAPTAVCVLGLCMPWVFTVSFPRSCTAVFQQRLLASLDLADGACSVQRAKLRQMWATQQEVCR